MTFEQVFIIFLHPGLLEQEQYRIRCGRCNIKCQGIMQLLMLPHLHLGLGRADSLDMELDPDLICLLLDEALDLRPTCCVMWPPCQALGQKKLGPSSVDSGDGLHLFHCLWEC